MSARVFVQCSFAKSNGGDKILSVCQISQLWTENSHAEYWLNLRYCFRFFFHFRSRDLAVDLLNFSWRSLLEFVMSSSGQLARLTSIYMIEWLCKRKFRQLYLLDGSISIHFASNRMVLYGRLNWFYLLNKNKWVYVLTINAFNWDEINDRANKTSDNITRVVVCMDFCLVCSYARVQKYQNIVTQT